MQPEPEAPEETIDLPPPSRPMLTPAALEAVKNWKYWPTSMAGNPVSVETESTSLRPPVRRRPNLGGRHKEVHTSDGGQ